jgi:hypothetical protein
MINNIKSLILVFLITGITISSCKKTEYSFGDLVSPSDVVLTTTVAGVTTATPNGNGTGKVSITTTANNAITYKIDFGDGVTKLVPSGSIEYQYLTPGTNEFTIVVNVIGTAGIISTSSKKVKVFVDFQIPTAIVTSLAGTSSKVWIADKDAPGHFGNGPISAYEPFWYKADPNSRAGCAYDDEMTFSKDANNNIYVTVDNKGTSDIIAAAVGFYGFSAAVTGDCYALNTLSAGAKKLTFSNANTGSTSANSTQIQFNVPGNGILNWGTGTNSYEIISYTQNTMLLRTIGIDGNSWYQRLKVK